MNEIEKEQAKTLLYFAQKNRWIAMVRAMKLILYRRLQPLDPEIFPALRLLAEMGIETDASCAGHEAKKCRCLPKGSEPRSKYYSGYIDFIPHRPYFVENLSDALQANDIIPVAVDLFMNRNRGITGVGINYFGGGKQSDMLMRLSWSFATMDELRDWWKLLPDILEAIFKIVILDLDPWLEINGVPAWKLLGGFWRTRET